MDLGQRWARKWETPDGRGGEGNPASWMDGVSLAFHSDRCACARLYSREIEEVVVRVDEVRFLAVSLRLSKVLRKKPDFGCSSPPPFRRELGPTESRATAAATATQFVFSKYFSNFPRLTLLGRVHSAK